MIGRRTSSSERIALCAPLGASLALLIAACGGGQESPPWAPREGNGTVADSSRGGSSTSKKDPDDPSDPGGPDSRAIDTSNVPPFNAGAASDTTLRSLTDGELDALCQRAENYFTATVPLAVYERARCYDISGAEFAETPAECLADVDACLSTTSFDYLGCALQTLMGEDDCEATVEEYGACMEESLSYNKAAADYYDCNRSDGLVEPSQLSAIAYDCETLITKCPEL